MNNQTNQVIEINENEVNENTAPKKTKAELVEAMKRLYVEIQSITEDLTALKDEAKERGMDAALMAKVAKAQADSKLDDILIKNTAFEELAEEVRNSY